MTRLFLSARVRHIPLFRGKAIHLPCLGLMLLFGVLVAANWIGFLASDDMTYAKGAYGWLSHFPYVGGHGTIRYPITMPMALFFGLFGTNEVTLVLPSLLAMLVALVLGWQIVHRFAGERPANIALLLLVTSPLLVIQSSIASVDIIEMMFIMLAFRQTLWAQEGDRPETRLLYAGLAIGFAFLTRETAIFLIPFYAILFVTQYRLPRSKYLWVAVGFFGVWALEGLYLGIMTGDPLYRLNIALHHDPSINRHIDLAGNMVVHPLVDPWLVLLLNQEFMLLYFAAVPLGLWLCFSHRLTPHVRHLGRMVGGLGLVWFLCVGGAQHLLPLNPRYFMVTTVAAALITGLGVAQMSLSRPRGAGLALLGLVAGNALGLAVENKQNQFGVRSLVAVAQAHPGRQITTDPMSRYRADLLLQWGHVAHQVHAGPPSQGALYVYNPRYATAPNALMTLEEMAQYQRPAGWIRIVRLEPEPSFMARFIDASGLVPWVPSRIWRKLRDQHPPVDVLQAPQTMP